MALAHTCPDVVICPTKTRRMGKAMVQPSKDTQYGGCREHNGRVNCPVQDDAMDSARACYPRGVLHQLLSTAMGQESATSHRPGGQSRHRAVVHATLGAAFVVVVVLGCLAVAPFLYY
jgi:hypothetical protein